MLNDKHKWPGNIFEWFSGWSEWFWKVLEGFKRSDYTFHRLSPVSEITENSETRKSMHTAHTWIYLILDRWPDDLTSHEEDDKFFSRTPILLSALLTLEAIKVFQVTDISDNKYRHFFPRSVMIYLKNITLMDENNIQEASFHSKQDAWQGHDDVLIYV